MNALAMGQNTVAQTASILVNNLMNVLQDPRVSPNRLEEALRPFAVIQWTRPVIEHITVSKMNRLFGRLKQAGVPRATLRIVIEHFKRALSDEPAIVPVEFTEWRDIVSRASLTDLANPDTWLAAWNALALHRIPDARTLSRVSILEIQTIAEVSPFGDLITPLWQAVRLEQAQEIGTPTPVVALRANLDSIPEALRAPSVELSQVGTEYEESKIALGLPANFDNLPPMARINALQGVTPDSQHLLRFLSAGAQANILQQVRHTLPCVASGVACYLAFCSLLSIAPFPPTTKIVRQWSTIFSTGRTFAVYVNHLIRVCQLLELDCSWRDETIKAIAKGIANKERPTQRFPNSLSPEWLDKLIQNESWDSELARLCYVTYLFMLRLPSEALPLHRALTDEQLLSNEAPSNTAVIGLREYEGQQRLTIKLARRKNSRGIFTALRPCYCGKNALLPRHNCPIHIFWANVITSTQPGDPLFPSLANKNINRVLRAAFKKIALPGAEKYSSHCFRRGAASAILNAGSTLAEIMQTAGWKSSSFRVYLDIQRAEEVSMRAVLAGGDSHSPTASEDDETSPGTNTPPAKTKKL